MPLKPTLPSNLDSTMAALTGKRNNKSSAVRRQKPPRAASKPAPTRRKGANGPDAATVYERIWSAIMDHSLPPETRLVEERLCGIFGMGRTRLRQVLQRLAHERVVTLMHNRGAMVSMPSVREAREVFAARRILEASIVATFIESATRADCRRIHDYLAREQLAWSRNDRREALKLSGDFHLAIAEIAGNNILVDMLRDLVSRSSLIIAVYQAPGTPFCPPDAHQELVAALERRDPGAVDLMLHHLDHVLADLRFEQPGDQPLDLRSVFAQPAKRTP
jgi:DNA-binding GntR family transcriptional regulator